ncbi:MAG: tripartite tricarboxylate transporter substrate binding protein [Betaproteobacteria bacterium]|nr:tripartite tricarboxylate transporter substrate binding protein [Betaproteobacteria bacterium]
MKCISYAAAGWCAAALLWVPTAHAQSYPNKIVRVIVPFVAGGPTDIQGRWVAQQLSHALAQNFIVENRGGAGGVPGTDMVVRAAPDGYTLLAGNPGPLTVSHSVYNKMPYDTLRDLAPIFLLTRTSSCLMVHPSVPVKGVQDFIKLAKAQPGRINYGSPGVGTVGHFATELFASQAGIQLNHVPYKGAAQYTVDLIAGQIEFASVQFSGCAPLVAQNKLRAIGATSEKRSPLLPHLPTVAEQGLPGFTSANWNGVLAPAKTPREVIMRIHDVLAKQMAAPEHREWFLKQGHDIASLGPEDYTKFIRDEIEKWARVAKAANIQKQ